MKTLYKWRVECITWEDALAIQRKFELIAGNIYSLLETMENLGIDVKNTQIQTITNKGRYFK